MDALGINAGNLFINIILFLIAILIISKLIAGPLQKMVSSRQSVIDKGLEDARTAADLRSKAEKEYQDMINEAKEKSAQIIKDGTDQVVKMKQDYRDSVDEQAQKELMDSREYLKKERELMLSNLRGQIIDLSISGAKKIIGHDLENNIEKQQANLTDFFTGIKEEKFSELSAFPNQLVSIEVTTAIPLTDKEKGVVIEKIKPKLDWDAHIQFNVDPKILGGIIIHSGDYLIDASLSGKAQGLKEALHK